VTSTASPAAVLHPELSLSHRVFTVLSSPHSMAQHNCITVTSTVDPASNRMSLERRELACSCG
jgi:hypothetical protein